MERIRSGDDGEVVEDEHPITPQPVREVYPFITPLTDFRLEGNEGKTPAYSFKSLSNSTSPIDEMLAAEKDLMTEAETSFYQLIDLNTPFKKPADNDDYDELIDFQTPKDIKQHIVEPFMHSDLLDPEVDDEDPCDNMAAFAIQEPHGYQTVRASVLDSEVDAFIENVMSNSFSWSGE